MSAMSAVDLGVGVAKRLSEEYGSDAISGSVLGNVLQAGNGQNPARQVAVRGGFDPTARGLTLNDVCLSSMTSVAYAAAQVANDECWLVGGLDSMSRADRTLTDSDTTLVVSDGLTCALESAAHGVIADVDDRRHGVSRRDADEYALGSFRRAKAATRSGFLAAEIVPISTPSGEISADEGLRDTSLDELSRLAPAFTDGGTVTAGNASQMSDGASLGLLAGEQWVRRRETTPLAKVVSSAHVAGEGGSLHEMPAIATERLLAGVRVTTADVGLWEINEAFAGVVLTSQRRLGVELDVVNVNGGAIALGHPLAASGFRLVLTLARAMRDREVELGVAAMCGGGGQGAAVLLELIDL